MLLLWAVYLGFGSAMLLVVRWLERPVPRRWAVVLLFLPVAFCLPGFLGRRTLLPIEHVRIFPPWSAVSDVRSRNANLNDAATQIAPWAKAVRMAWKEGSLPWRDRWNGCGMALAANGQSAAFSPFTFLMFPIPLPEAFTLSVAAKLFLALLGVLLWLREMEIRLPAAFFGATAFAFSLTMTPWLLFSLSAVFCLWPWALFAIERLFREPSSGRGRLLLALVLGCWILAGHPESAVLGAILIALFLAARALLRDETIRRASLAAIAASGLLAAGISAFLWVPELLAIRASNRYSLAGAIRESLPVTLAPHAPGWRYGFLTSIFPRVLGDDFGSPRLANAAASFPEMALGYFGIVAWAVALLIFRPGARRDRRELALLAPLVCGLAVGTGTWPIFDSFLSIPLVKLVLPLRSFAMVSVAGCATAAFELDRIGRREGNRSRIGDAAPAAVLATALVLAFLRFRSAHAASGGLVPVRQALAVSLLALLAGALVLLWPRSETMLSPAAMVLLAAIGTAELFWQGATLYRWGAAPDLFPPTPLVKFLQSQDRPFRVVGEDAALFPNTNVFAGIESIQTHDAMERRDYVTFLDASAGYDPKPYFKHVRNLDASVLDFMNVRFLVTSNPAREESDRWKLAYSGPDGRVFENRRVLPRVFAPRQIRFEGADSSPEMSMPSDWSDLAVVRRHPEVSGSRVVLAQNLPIEVTRYRESTNQVAFRAHSSGPMEQPILVTSLVQDGGWSASDESGKPLTTLRANGIFLALAIGPGTHDVRLDYRPPGLAAGAAVSLAAAAVLVWWVWIAGRMALRTRGRP